MSAIDTDNWRSGGATVALVERLGTRRELIGRDHELETVAAAFARGARVVTLVGAPGAGKSAVALAFARGEADGSARHRRISARLPVIVCSLGGARSPESLLSALAHVLGASQGTAHEECKMIPILGRLLAQRGRTLCVLDDADAVIGSLSRVLTELIRTAPEAVFLVTSRARLGLHAEATVEIPPLALPPVGEEDPAAIASSDSVRLLVAKVRPGYRPPPGEAATLARIARRLDGIPLALELCAARIGVLGERAVAELLHEGFDILDRGRLPPHGRTLYGALSLSWDLLDEDGRRALARLSVYEGSFDLAGATAIMAGDARERQARVSAAAELDKLEARSLLRVFEPEAFPGGRRYSMLANVRAFAADRLSERGEARDARLRLAAHLARLPAPPATERVARLAHEQSDLAQAWRTAMRERDLATATRIALRAEPLALARGPITPYVAMLDELLASPGLAPELAAPLHLSRGLARAFRGRRDQAAADLDAARHLGREARLGDVLALATSKLGLTVGLEEDFARARRLFRDALRAPDTPARVRGIILTDLASVLAEANDNDEAMVTLGRARDLLHEAGEVREEGLAAMLVGAILLDEGRVADAERDLRAALELLRLAGDRRSEAWTTALVAMTEAERGDHAPARAKLESAARALQTVGDENTEGRVLAFLGHVALEQGLLGDAERAYREARRLLEEAGDEGPLGFVLAAASLVDRRLGHLAAARGGLSRAVEIAARDRRPPRAQAVLILAGAAGDPAAPARGAQHDSAEVRFARRVVRAAGGSRAEVNARSGVVVTAKDGSWVRLASGETVRFGRSRTLRAVVACLVTERLRAPGEPVAPGALLRAGWPEERILPAAAKNRLHVTIARLRRLGLGSLISHDQDGYLLDPSLDLRQDEEL